MKPLYRIESESFTGLVARLVYVLKVENPELGKFEAKCLDGSKVTIRLSDGPAKLKDLDHPPIMPETHGLENRSTDSRAERAVPEGERERRAGNSDPSADAPDALGGREAGGPGQRGYDADGVKAWLNAMPAACLTWWKEHECDGSGGFVIGGDSVQGYFMDCSGCDRCLKKKLADS